MFPSTEGNKKCGEPTVKEHCPPKRNLWLKSSTIQPLGQEGAQGFPGGTVVENLPANAGDTGSSPGLGRSHMPRSN